MFSEKMFLEYKKSRPRKILDLLRTWVRLEKVES